jgi:hypothetical protein
MRFLAVVPVAGTDRCVDRQHNRFPASPHAPVAGAGASADASTLEDQTDCR